MDRSAASLRDARERGVSDGDRARGRGRQRPRGRWGCHRTRDHSSPVRLPQASAGLAPPLPGDEPAVRRSDRGHRSGSPAGPGSGRAPGAPSAARREATSLRRGPGGAPPTLQRGRLWRRAARRADHAGGESTSGDARRGGAPLPGRRAQGLADAQGPAGRGAARDLPIPAHPEVVGGAALCRG